MTEREEHKITTIETSSSFKKSCILSISLSIIKTNQRKETIAVKADRKVLVMIAALRW